MILLSVTLARYSQWEATNYGKWLASAANDPYLDLVPPLVTTGLSRRFGDWWNSTFMELTGFVLSRYVVQQHQSMSYEKTWTGERCLLQVDGPKIISTGGFDKIGMGNPRLRSCHSDSHGPWLDRAGRGGSQSPHVGRRTFLKREMAKEATHEVS